MHDDTKWMSTAQVCEFLAMSSRTLERRRKRAVNPFPEPDVYCAGSQNKWECHKVKAWQSEEKKLSQPKPLAVIHGARDERSRLIPPSEV